MTRVSFHGTGQLLAAHSRPYGRPVAKHWLNQCHRRTRSISSTEDPVYFVTGGPGLYPIPTAPRRGPSGPRPGSPLPLIRVPRSPARDPPYPSSPPLDPLPP